VPFTSVGEKEMRVAPGAEPGQVDIFVSDTGLGQLIPTGLPEIEMEGRMPVFPKRFGQLIPKVDKFGTTWPQGWTDATHQILHSAMEVGGHAPDGLPDDVLYAAPPSGMNIGHHPFHRIDHEHRLTVRHENHQGSAFEVRHQGVPIQLPSTVAILLRSVAIFSENPHLTAMDLAAIHAPKTGSEEGRHPLTI
jgi:hypothetical protein